MIKDIDCYKKIGESIVLTEYFKENINYFSSDEYCRINFSVVPMNIVLSEPVLKNINDRFKIQTGAIMRLDPNRCYVWHRDLVRGVCINLLLSPEVESFVLFGSRVLKDQYETLKFQYEPKTFYLFNPQIMHTAINFDSPRYLFTIEFKEDKTKLNYNMPL